MSQKHDEETTEVRQNNELEVLKSIFANELRDLRENKQKRKWKPLHISITLTPQKGMSGPAKIYTQVDLHVICGEKYPNEAPQILLENSKGLSNQQLATELSELETLARNSIGEVMIYDLCQHVQKFLHQYNTPRYSSFYEEMVSKQQEKIQFEMQEKQIKEDKERQVLQDEISKRQEAYKEMQMCNRRESTRLTFEDLHLSKAVPNSPHERVKTFARKRCTSTSESSEGSLCEHRGTKLLNFDNNKRERQVTRGKCLGHSKKGSIVYAGVDSTSGELLAITEWTIKCTSGHDNGDTNNLQNLMKQIAAIEQELNHLYKLQNINLVHYLNMKYLQDKDNIIVYFLQEFVFGTSCSYYLKENIPLDKDMLKYLATGILNGLLHLHENNVVHRDLRDSNVYIDRAGIIRLANYSLEKRLSDLQNACSTIRVEHEGRSGKKGDIYKFGMLLLSLARGSIVTEDDEHCESYCNNLQPDLKDFILKCLVKDDRSRCSAEQLLQHCFIQTPPKRGLPPPTLDGKKEKNFIEPEEEPDDGDIPFDLSAFGGQSRLKNEFEVLKWLGNGAFGDVLKVRNKLDGGLYALKRIKLNPKNKLLNKKMTREVKLLSRLNHENVVRYYNSWIESATLDDTTYNAFMPSATPLTSTTRDKTILSSDYKFGSESIEKLAPPMHEVEWNISYEAPVKRAADDSEEDNSDQCDDSDSDTDWNIPTETKTDGADESDSIEFAESEISHTSLSRSACDTPDGAKRSKSSMDKKEIQFMYLQMEFCEKSTLRTAIDSELYKDEDRIWRLFREMVDGLSHIHQKGMIHRDLKPVNIFLDSNDHVKIGDFGLATTNILSNLPNSSEKESQSDKGLSSEKDYSESLTGQVGTVLYVAPELSTQADKAIYNQKVDIYSLGIIFFEMCYKPGTGMERVEVILNMRSKEIIFPLEFKNITNVTNKVHLLRWLLNHDPSQRPAANELLSSDSLPPPQLEEAELQEMVRHTLSDAQSKSYKYLVNCCFSQEATPAEDMTYDMPFPDKKSQQKPQVSPFIQEYVKSKVLHVFQKHGGQCITTPLLMPKSSLYNLPDNSVQLMTRTGSVVSVPYDLRASFARYVAWNAIKKMRRYSIERVYRENKNTNQNQSHIGFHPRELYECAFDIISTEVILNSEAELIAIIWEIYNEFPELQDLPCTVRINHNSLLQAVLMACGIEPEKFQDIYSILRDARKLKHFQVETHLTSLCLTEQALNMLIKLFEIEFSISALPEELKYITRRKGDIATLSKQGLKDIENVVYFAEALGVKWPFVVAPLFVHNIEQYSGTFFQITLKKRKRISQDVIAAGGRYDKILLSYRQFLQRTGIMNHEEQFGVGVSISLDKLALAVSKDITHENKVATDVAVCCMDGETLRNRELADVLRELWALNLKVDFVEYKDIDDIQEYCRENSINHIVILRNGERGLRILSWENTTRYHERKINIKELSDFFQRQAENNTATFLNRSDSSISSSPPYEKMNVNFILANDDKLSAGSRRNHKNAMIAQITPIFERTEYKIFELFATNLDIAVIRLIGSHLELGDEEDFQKSLLNITSDSKIRASLKKYIIEICEILFTTVKAYEKENKRPIMFLYSLQDSRFKRID